MRSLALLLLGAPALAGDLTVTAGAPEGRRLEVEVGWSDSWRNEAGRDGIWLFTKARGGDGWETAEVRAAVVTGGALEASPSRDGRGVFVSRAEAGRGDVSGRLQLTFAAALPGAVRPFGVEVVYVEPEGTPACWLAKHELGQGLYAAFLDTLPTQATFARSPLGGRTYGGPTGTITREGERYVTPRPDAACGFLGWEDACAVADWAGLRPPRAAELRAVQERGGLWEPALEGARLALTHGDGRLTRGGRATNDDWGVREVVLLGAPGVPPRGSALDRRPGVGFRPARTAPGTRPVLVLGTDALAALPMDLERLARAGGVPRPPRVTLRARAGDRFERMAASDSLREELASGRYEVVVLQEDLVVQGSARRSAEFARPLVEAARAGGATPVLVMTWGLRDRPSVAFETASANVAAWAQELGVEVAPMGLAWRRAATAGAQLHDEGGRNPSAEGAWLNACVLHHVLFGELPLVPDDALGAVAQRVVREYVQPR